MFRFCEMVEKEVPNFVGVEYIHHDMVEATTLLKHGRNIVWGMDKVLIGALAVGMDTFMLTTLNICPELVMEIVDRMRQNKLNEAMMFSEKLMRRIDDIYVRGSDWIMLMKNEFNKMHTGMKVGPCRKPVLNIVHKPF